MKRVALTALALVLLPAAGCDRTAPLGCTDDAFTFAVVVPKPPAPKPPAVKPPVAKPPVVKEPKRGAGGDVIVDGGDVHYTHYDDDDCEDDD